MKIFHINDKRYFEGQKKQSRCSVSYRSVYFILFLFIVIIMGMGHGSLSTTEVFAQTMATPTPLIILGGTNVSPSASQPLNGATNPLPSPEVVTSPPVQPENSNPPVSEVNQPSVSLPETSPFSDTSNDAVWPWGYKNPEPKASYNSSAGSSSIKKDTQEGETVVSIQQTKANLVSTVGGAIYRVSVYGNYAYIGKAYHLTIMNVTNPAAPLLEGTTSSWSDMVLGVDVDTKQTYAYVAAGNQGLRIVDITDKKNPKEISYYNNFENGRAYDVRAFNSRLFVAGGEAGLQILDVSNPKAPKKVGCFDTNGKAYDVEIFTKEANGTQKVYAAIADEYEGLRIVDVTNSNCPCPCPPTDPTCPVEVTYYNEDSPKGRAVGVVIDPLANVAYVADDEDGLLLVDISDLSKKPLPLLGKYDTPQHTYSVDVSFKENIAFIGDGNQDVIAVNVSDPKNPQYLGSISFCDVEGNCFANDVKVFGSYVFVADPPMGLHVVNAANPKLMSAVYYYYSPSSTMGVEYQGYAYVTANSAGLRIIQFPNYNKPNPDGSLPNYSEAREVGFYDTPGWAYAVQINWPYAYVADWDKGLRIINVSNPNAPYEISYIDTSGLARDVALYNGYAYIADKMNGVRVIDVRDPKNPTEVQSPSFNNECKDARAVYAAGGYIFVADGMCGLRVFEAAAPEHNAQVDTLGAANDVIASGNMIYVAASSGGGVQAIRFDIDRTVVPPVLRLTPINSVDTEGEAFGVDLSGQLLYVADGSQGIQIFDVSDPMNGMPEISHYQTRGSAGNVRAFLNAIFVAGGDGGLQILQMPISTVTSSISGRVTLNGVGLSGVTLSNNDGATTTTDNNGYYTFSSLIGKTYTITPLLSGYSFSPANRSVKVPPNATNQDFTASVNCLAGQIVDTSSKPISNVTVSISGTSAYTVYTDANGYYSAVGTYTNCGGVANGTYTITPSKTIGGQKYSFYKPSETVSVPPGRTNINFVGSIAIGGPSGVITETQPTFVWASAGDGSNLRYRLFVLGPRGNVIDQWYDGSKICKDDYCSVKPDVALLEGKYTWQVQTYGSNGISGLIMENNFTVSQVGVPTLISPFQKISETKPTYSWSKVAKATQYRLAVNSINNVVLDAVFDTEKICQQDKCSVKLEQALAAGNYQWKVQAIIPQSDGQWSEPLSFTIQ